MGGTSENPYAGQGPVLLDIGGDVGALVVVMPAHTDGLEVELRPAGATAGAVADGATPGNDHAHPHSHPHPHPHDHSHDDSPDHTNVPDHGEQHRDVGHGEPHHHGPGGGPVVGSGTAYPHVGVVGRPDGDAVVYSLVYPSAPEGDYELFVLPSGPVTMTASVTGGQVTRTRWPD